MLERWKVDPKMHITVQQTLDFLSATAGVEIYLLICHLSACIIL